MSILLRIEAARNRQIAKGMLPQNLKVLIGSAEERELQTILATLPDKGKVLCESFNIEFVLWVSGVVCGTQEVLQNFLTEVEIC